MAEVVLEVVAAVLEHVEALVLDLPARPCAGGELGHGLARDRQIGDEAVAVGELALRVADLDRQPVDRERVLVGPQRDVAEPAVVWVAWVRPRRRRSTCSSSSMPVRYSWMV